MMDNQKAQEKDFAQEFKDFSRKMVFKDFSRLCEPCNYSPQDRILKFIVCIFLCNS